MTHGQPPHIQNIVPCECGSREPYWHGDTLRVYCCDECWRKRIDAEHGDAIHRSLIDELDSLTRDDC